MTSIVNAQSFDRSILPISTTPQTYMDQGESVAVSDNYLIVGKPGFDFEGFERCGAVDVYNAADHSLIATIINPEPESSEFGCSVALFDDTLVVGAQQSRGPNNTAQGAAWVFDLSAATIGEPQFKFVPNVPAASLDRFGAELAIEGTTIAVSSVSPLNPGLGGYVHVFDIASKTPTQPILIYEEKDGSNELFGQSIDLADGLLVVGIPVFAGNGFVHVYDLNAADPTIPIHILTAPISESDKFGESVSIESGNLVVGDSYSYGASAGHAYVYDLNGPSPTEPVFTLPSPGPGFTGFGFGNAVSIDWPYVVVGEPYRGSPETIRPGAAYLFDLTEINPTIPVAELVDPNRGKEKIFGDAVSVFGSSALVGAPGRYTNIEPSTAVVFDLNASNPGTASDVLNLPIFPSSHQRMGRSVATDGVTLVAGAPFDDGGRVLLYALDSPDVEPAILSVAQTGDASQFGVTVAVDGRWVAIGERTTSSSSSRIYIFDLDSGDLTTPRWVIDDPTPGNNEYFGFGILISGDRLVVSGYGDNDAGSGSGTVFVFDLSSNTPTSPTLTIPNPDSDGYFAASLSLWQNTLAVGRIFDQDGGSAFLFNLNSSTPDQPILHIPHPTRNDSGGRFGISLSMNAERLVVGAPLTNIGGVRTGAAYVFDLTSSEPGNIEHTLVSPDPIADGYFGILVAKSGPRIFIHEHGDNGGFYSGIVNSFDLESTVPTSGTQIVSPVPDEFTFFEFGKSMAVTENELFVGSPGDNSFNFLSGAVHVYRFGPQLIPTTLMEINRGIVKQGGFDRLEESDDIDYSVCRNPAQIQSMIELSASGVAPDANGDQLTVVFEASVFARGEVTQTIEMFNFNTKIYEQLDVRPASRFVDSRIEIPLSGDVSRFIEPSTGTVNARVRFIATKNRMQFTANIDQLIWIQDL